MIDKVGLIKENADDSTPPEKEEKKIEWNGRSLLVVAGLLAGGAIVFTAAYEALLLTYEIVHDKVWRPNIEELKTNINKKFTKEVVDKLEQLKGLDTTRLFKRLSICKEEEQQILTHLVEKFDLNDNQLEEILMGAHVRLADDGELYNIWNETILGKQARISSHPSNAQQYGISGPFVKQLLFSSVEEKGTVYTWFQLENHPVSFGHLIRHMVDFFKYKLSNEQQGPYGSSKATHHQPIIIFSKKLQVEVIVE